MNPAPPVISTRVTNLPVDYKLNSLLKRLSFRSSFFFLFIFLVDKHFTFKTDCDVKTW